MTPLSPREDVRLFDIARFTSCGFTLPLGDSRATRTGRGPSAEKGPSPNAARPTLPRAGGSSTSSYPVDDKTLKSRTPLSCGWEERGRTHFDRSLSNYTARRRRAAAKAATPASPHTDTSGSGTGTTRTVTSIPGCCRKETYDRPADVAMPSSWLSNSKRT